MTSIFLYGGVGTYTGNSEYEWDNPLVGSTHKLILFLAQETNESQEKMAYEELVRFGFSEVEVSAGKPIAVEVLNEPQMQAFQKHYEGALAEGCSIVWYP